MKSTFTEILLRMERHQQELARELSQETLERYVNARNALDHASLGDAGLSVLDAGLLRSLLPYSEASKIFCKTLISIKQKCSVADLSLMLSEFPEPNLSSITAYSYRLGGGFDTADHLALVLKWMEAEIIQDSGMSRLFQDLVREYFNKHRRKQTSVPPIIHKAISQSFLECGDFKGLMEKLIESGARKLALSLVFQDPTRLLRDARVVRALQQQDILSIDQRNHFTPAYNLTFEVLQAATNSSADPWAVLDVLTVLPRQSKATSGSIPSSDDHQALSAFTAFANEGQSRIAALGALSPCLLYRALRHDGAFVELLFEEHKTLRDPLSKVLMNKLVKCILTIRSCEVPSYGLTHEKLCGRFFKAIPEASRTSLSAINADTYACIVEMSGKMDAMAPDFLKWFQSYRGWQDHKLLDKSLIEDLGL